MNKEIKKVDKNSLNKTKIGKLKLLDINTTALNNALSDLSIPRLFYQLVVFVLDASQSMTNDGISGKTKGEEVHNQIKPIMKRLSASKNSDSFDISMYSFSQSHKEFITMRNLKSIDIDNFDFNPCNHIGNYQTFAEPVLLEVEKNISTYLLKHKDKNSQAMIVFLGDGDIYDYSKVINICNRLKNNKKVTILSYLLEDKSWSEDFLPEELEELRDNIKHMSSKDVNGLNFFDSKVNPEDIRKHMIKSISTVSKID